MSQRPSRTPVANLALAAVLTLCLLPVSVPLDAGGSARNAGPRVQPRAAESRLLDRLERLRTALWQDVISLWGKAGARIDDNGKS